MDVERYSKRCIKKYLAKYHLVLETYEKDDHYGLIGDLTLFIKIHHQMGMDASNLIKIGHLHYSVSEKVLHIDTLYIKSRHKPDTTIALTKVLLLYLLSLYHQDIDYATLSASSYDVTKKDTELCLSCFYQKMGFEPVDFDTKNMIKKCEKYIGKHNENNMCILCKCQQYSKANKNILIFQREIADHLQLDLLQIDMKAKISKIKHLLREANKEINVAC
jgi:hypothetical protein